MKRALLCLLLPLSGCLDFTAAKFQCYDAGWCEHDQGDPPTLTSHLPVDQAANVAIADPLSLTFSRAMLESSLQVQLTPDTGLQMPDWDDDDLSTVLAPTDNLRFATQYTVRVNGQAADDRTPMQTASFTFTTRGAPDTQAPTIDSTNPPDGQQTVAVTSALQIAFSEAMDPTSLRLLTNPDFDWGDPTWSSSNQTVTFTAPPTAMPPSTTFAVSIEAADVSGNPLTGKRTVTFTTRDPADVTPPVVLSVSPPDQSTGIDPHASIAVSFSETMNPAVVNAITITPDAGAACALDVAGALLTCGHSAQLATNTHYSITVLAAGAADLAGNPLAQDFHSSFTTGTMPDTTPPTVVSYAPLTGSKGQSYYPSMSVTFSEPMDKASVQAALVITSPTGITGSYSWDAPGKVVTFHPAPPSGGFLQSQVVAWQIGTGAKDLAGNPLAVTQLYSFTVRHRVTGVLLTGLTPDGYLSKNGSTYGVNASAADVAVGDSSGDYPYRAFLFFNLAGNAPSGFLDVYSATLTLDQYSVLNNPYALGSLVVESIPYATPITHVAWDATPYEIACHGLSCIFGGGYHTTETLSTSAAIGPFTFDAVGFVIQAQAAGKLELRMHFLTKDTDNDGVADIAYFHSADSATGKPTLSITYEVP